ncbi:hypothetical protein MJN54_34540, partial [Salmonella enterica subsp. enterica serovar Kentucky]|nr:hypothetical protein [Salmonella enterica subsp. enterica serovar Kentucky]
MLVLAADHAIANEEAFRDAVRGAMPYADAGKLVTFGIVPDLPAQGRRPPSSDVDAIEAENFESGGALKEISNPENLMLSEELRQ